MYILEQPSSWGTSGIGPSWPRSGYILNPYILLPRTTRYPAVCDSGSRFTPTSSAIWVASHSCTSKHHNNVTRHRAHMYIHHISITIHILSSFLLPTPLLPFWADWLSSIPSVHYNEDHLVRKLAGI
jgi:hypothetical protein